MNTILLLGVILLQFVLIAVLIRKFSSSSTDAANEDVKALEKSMQELREGLSDKLTERLDKNQNSMLESLQRQFAQSTKLVSDVTRDLTELKASNKQVLSVTDELKSLQNILQNPKQRGVLGEYYLQSVLENVLPPDRFAMQHRFKNGDIVDAVIHLDKKKILPIDSKFSLENYNRILEAKSADERERLLKLFRNDLKKRIDETSKYIRPSEHTLDHAFMFIPSEAIYYDLLVNKVGSSDSGARDLLEYAFRERQVIIVSPTTLLAYLQTVLQGMRSLQIEERAKDIQKRVAQLGRHITVYDDYMQRLGKSLGVSVNHFNNAHKELGKIDNDIAKITDTEASLQPQQLERPDLDE